MPETNEEPYERRAQNIAYAAGRRDADVDAHLRGHERRLNAINGSIDRMSAAVEALTEKVESRAAVEAARNEQLKRANEQQISNRTFWIGVFTICAMLLVGMGTVVASAGVH